MGKDSGKDTGKGKKGGKLKRRLLICGIVLVVVLVFLHFGLGYTVKLAAEQIGPHITGTTVKLGSADIYPILGYVRLENFELGNPPGYHTPHSLTVKKIVLDLGALSIFSRKKIVEEFTLTGVDLYYEQKLSSCNLLDLVRQMKGREDEEKEKKEVAEKAEDQKTSSPELRLQVTKLHMTDIDVHVVLSVSGGKVSAPIPMVPIVLEDLGTGEEGITVTDLTIAILNKLTLDAGPAVGKALNKTMDAASGAIGRAAKKTGTFLKKILSGRKQKNE